MKAFALTIFLSVFFGRHTANQVTTVYISTGYSAYSYHARQSCRTLKRCNEEGHVKAVTLEEARSMGRRPCKICYKTR